MAKVKCPKCAFVNPDGREVCVQCHHPLPKIKIAPAASGVPPRGNPGQAQQFQFRKGEVVVGRYTVLDVIGRGGMGCIYRVRDNVLKEEVALKTLLPEFIRDKMVIERFFNEARIARGLSHPNIVRVHDIGMTGDILYISMELIKGKSLRAMLEELPVGKRLPITTVLYVMDRLCAALEYAHQHTVHRDIKPENIMVCEGGQVKLMDFGISKLMTNTRLTGTSMIMGTPFYMSPEQLRDSSAVDARADIYSVGVVLYEILTGSVPTGMPKPASQLVREVPPALDPIVAKCVEPEPADRYQHVLELRRELHAISAQLTAGKDAVTAKPRQQGAGRPGMRKVVAVILLAAIVAMAALGLAGAEKNRRAAVTASRQRQANIVVPVEPNAFDEEFAALAGLVSRAEPRAAAASERHEASRKVYEDAAAQWKIVMADAPDRDPETLNKARRVLGCFLAPILWPPDMVFIPPGPVVIRHGAAEETVMVEGFFIDATEVTNAQYLQFCTETGWRQTETGWRHPYDLERAPPDHPVTMVTFYDAQAYAAWAKKRLPTEAQWARAAYGGRDASELYPWGEQWEAAQCNAGGEEDGFAATAPVGSFEGDETWSQCRDMAGNVSEWTRTIYKDLPYPQDFRRDDPAGLEFGTLLVVRGSNFQDASHGTLNARYSQLYAPAGDARVGFRCVLELPTRPEDIEACLQTSMS